MRPWSAEDEHRKRKKAAKTARIACADTHRDESVKYPCAEYCGGVNHVNCTYIERAVEYIISGGKENEE